MGNVPVAGTYPAVEFQPTETDSVYHTDQEVTDVSGNSQMYRTYNAQFDGSLWRIIPGGPANAYATVQDSAGSIHYYWNNGSSSWSAWTGSGNNAVYNAVDFGMSTATGFDNTGPLTDAINAAFANGVGGTIYIPPGTYHFSGTVDITFGGFPPGNDHGIIIAGGGGSTVLEQDEYLDLFSFSGLSDGNGVRIRDLRIAYAAPVNPMLQPAALRVSDCENITCERVYFYNCPQALNFENEANECGIRDCIIDYNASNDNQVMVSFSGSENFIDQCIMKQQPQGSDGPSGCSGIVITSVSTAYITNTHISDFNIGIDIQGGGVNLPQVHVTNVACEAWTYGIKIAPAVDGGEIYQVFLTACVFAMENGSTQSSPMPVGIYIDTDGGANTKVSDIFINNCICYQWSGPGVQINRGQNIVITGGRYGSNATALTTSGGIAITGTAASVTINGADCSPVVPGYGTQPYALSITAAVEGLYVRGCNFTGYDSGVIPIYVNSSAGTQIEVTDCAGYNDQGTVLGTTPPGSSFSNTSAWTGAPNGWFGPVAFYVMSAGDVSFGSNNTHLTQGEFTLSAGQTASIAGTITHFLAIGK